MLSPSFRQVLKSAVVYSFSNSFAQRLNNFIHRTKTIFLMYHGIAEDSEELESTTVVREGEFRRQMAYLRQNYSCLSIDDLISNSRPEGKDAPGAVVTFDDGYANNYTVALPILEQFEIPAVVYITTGNVVNRQLFWFDKIWIASKKSGICKIDLTGIAEPLRSYSLQGSGDSWQVRIHHLTEDIKKTDPAKREEIVDSIITRFRESPGAKPFELNVENNIFTPMTVEQVRTLSSHPIITIGSHSHCHSLLNQIPLAQAEESIVRSKDILEDITGHAVKHFSYPNGNLTPDIINVLKGNGFQSAVTVPTGFFGTSDDPYRIPRMMVGSYMSLDLFKAKLTGIFELGYKLGF